MGMMSPEERRRKWREKKRRQRARRTGDGYEQEGRTEPDFYREDEERMCDYHTRLDIRKVATIVSFLEEKYGMRFGSRSDMLRAIVDLVYTGIEDSTGHHKFEWHKEAYLFLEERRLAPGRGTKRGDKFYRNVIANESFDIEHRGVKEEKKLKDFEGWATAGMLMDLGADETLQRVRSALANKGYDPEEFIDYYERIEEQGEREQRRRAYGSKTQDNEVIREQGMSTEELRKKREQEDRDQLDKMKNAFKTPKPK
jgi:hypothetical protein